MLTSSIISHLKRAWLIAVCIKHTHFKIMLKSIKRFAVVKVKTSCPFHCQDILSNKECYIKIGGHLSEMMEKITTKKKWVGFKHMS